MSFDVKLVILLRKSVLFGRVSWRSQRSMVTILRNFGLNFLVMIDLFSFVFTDFLWQPGNWILST